MKVIPREAGRITYSTEIRNLKKLPLSNTQMAAVLGSILGDGCLCANWSKTNYRLKISHSIKQNEYLLWKYNILKSLVLSKPRVCDKTQSITIRTISHSELSILRNIFYKKNKKIIPKNIEVYIKNPLTIAIWFMDDGNVKRIKRVVEGYHLNTQSFTLKENKFIADEFMKLYGINMTIQNNNGYPRLYIQKKSTLVFRNLIEPYILESMKYKLG